MSALAPQPTSLAAASLARNILVAYDGSRGAEQALSCAAVHCDRATGLCWAGGYAGEGVAAANLAGRTLRDLILGRDTELTRLPWVGHGARAWEPEPLRWLAVHTVYGALRAADSLEDRSGRPSRLARMAGALARS